MIESTAPSRAYTGQLKPEVAQLELFQSPKPGEYLYTTWTWQEPSTGVVCFECDSPTNINQHHVVPRVLGGTRTIPLCEGCHSKVHGRNMVGHRRLVIEGQRRAVLNGQKLGRPVGQDEITIFLAKHPDIIRLVQAETYHSIRTMARMTKKAPGTVARVRKVLSDQRDKDFLKPVGPTSASTPAPSPLAPPAGHSVY